MMKHKYFFSLVLDGWVGHMPFKTMAYNDERAIENMMNTVAMKKYKIISYEMKVFITPEFIEDQKHHKDVWG